MRNRKQSSFSFICILTVTYTSLCNDEALLCHISLSQTELSASVSHADLTPNCITLKNHRREQKSSVGLFSCYFRRRRSFTPATHTWASANLGNFECVLNQRLHTYYVLTVQGLTGDVCHVSVPVHFYMCFTCRVRVCKFFLCGSSFVCEHICMCLCVHVFQCMCVSVYVSVHCSK